MISDSETVSNTVSGNYIGTDVNGTVDLGNGYFGVEISNGAQHNIVGGDTAAARNVISANDDCGVALCGTGTMHNVLSGNYIGANVSGAVALASFWCETK